VLSTLTRPDARSTLTRSTPSSFESSAETARTQWSQVMPTTVKVCSIIVRS
jgi:hypothetical protein